MEVIQKQTLYLVATPIGNLSEISNRALFVLNNVDMVLCEDTRHSGSLFKQLGINALMWSFHKHNSKAKIPEVLDKLQSGCSIALISDAGMPLINDPGHDIVKKCYENGFQVLVVSGPCAVINAVALSGFPEDGFTFNGFIPVKRRKEFLASACAQQLTQVFFEAPHRIIATCDDLVSVVDSDREVFIVKELTKLYETSIRVPASLLLEAIKKHNFIKGEIVIVVSKQSAMPKQVSATVLEIMHGMRAELKDKSIVRYVHELTKIPKNDLYKALVEYKN